MLWIWKQRGLHYHTLSYRIWKQFDASVLSRGVDPQFRYPTPDGKAGFEVWVLTKGGLVSVHHCRLTLYPPPPQTRDNFAIEYCHTGFGNRVELWF